MKRGALHHFLSAVRHVPTHSEPHVPASGSSVLKGSASNTTNTNTAHYYRKYFVIVSVK